MVVVFNSVVNVYGGAKYFMDRDIVFVTFNNRLGMLGSCIFLTATVAVIS
jgi:carboxylesterase type B